MHRPGTELQQKMAALNFTAISLRKPGKCNVTGNRHNPTSFLPGKSPMRVSAIVSSTESSPTVPEKPEIELEFIGVNFSLLVKILCSSKI